MPRIDPDWFSVPPDDAFLGPDELEAPAAAAGAPLSRPIARCSVCRRPLQRGERKVHAGHCALVRKTALQRRRRSGARVCR